jgi:predicted ABC-type transport system involved in lysophospholipase L1 biosynthesis ATPase subunit
MSEPVLRLRGLGRTYVTAAGPLPVLRGVDLEVAAGELVGLVGPSGSGKSSLLHAAGLLERPDAGTVEVVGADCGQLSEAERTRVRLSTLGFVYQFHHLLPEFTACLCGSPACLWAKPRRGRGPCWRISVWLSGLPISPHSFRAGSSSAWR